MATFLNPVHRHGVAVAALLVAAAVASGCSRDSTTSTDAARAAGSSSSSAPDGSPSPSGSPDPAPAGGAAPVPVESNPPGDIPDNLAFVPYSNAVGGYSFTHPEGWAETGARSQVRFTDKLNGVFVDVVVAGRAPTVASARAADVPRLREAVPAFELRDISAVDLPAGPGVRIVFRRNSDPDAVTGRVYRDEVEEFMLFHAGRVVRMDLYGPVGADNVDAYRTMSTSLSIP